MIKDYKNCTRDYSKVSPHTHFDAKKGVESCFKATVGGFLLILTGVMLFGLLCLVDAVERQPDVGSFYTSVR